MYEIMHRGSLFDLGCEMLVNPVNCVGVDGAGLALEFKQRFPDNSRFYQRACHAGHMYDGQPLLYSREPKTDPNWIVNFPTKHHWRERGNVHLIWSGLAVLDAFINTLTPASVAIPALGCGLGGLPFDQIEPMIRTMLLATNHPKIEVRVYAPQGFDPATSGENATVDHLEAAPVGDLLVHNPSRQPRHHGPMGK